MFEKPMSIYQTNWSWEHRPDFVNLPPVVRSLSSIVTTMPNIQFGYQKLNMQYSDLRATGISENSLSSDKLSNNNLNYTLMANDLFPSVPRTICFEDKI